MATQADVKTGTAFTPGPWKLTSISQDTGAIGICKERVMIAEVHNGYSFMDVVQGRRPKEQFANAYLIEAAPELYEAIERAIRLLETARDQCPANNRLHRGNRNAFNSAVEIVRAATANALAKARGGTAAQGMETRRAETGNTDSVAKP